ncbi:MAG: hypothetical protein WCW77_04815 [Patescibacteria group bacterium]|jgi:hypothetical protein
MKKYINEIFRVLTASLLIFIALELIWPGMVISYINLNLVLIFWLVNVIFLMSERSKTN